MSEMLVLSSTTFVHKIEGLMQELPQEPIGEEESQECIKRLQEMIKWIQKNMPKGCSNCEKRGNDMRIRQKCAKICNNCEKRAKNVCTVNGSDKRVNVVDGTCPKDKFKGVNK